MHMTQQKNATASSHTYVWKRALLLLLLLCFTEWISAANITWSGNTSTAWNVATNWVGNTVPGNNDNAIIVGSRPNYPVINSNINVRNITINSSGTGGTLTILSGTVNARRLSVRAGGFLNISGGSLSGTRLSVTGTLTMSNGVLLSTGTASINSGGIINQSGGTLFLGNNINGNPSADLQVNAGGVYNQSGGTVTIVNMRAGSGMFNQTGTTALFKIYGNWQMGTGSTFNSTSGTFQVADDGNNSNYATGTRQFNNIIIDNGVDPGFDNANPSTFPISGNFTNNSTSFSSNTNATFTFNGTGNQTIFSAITNTSATFGNLVVNKPSGIVTLLSNIYSSGNLTVTAGTLDCDTRICNRSTNGGSFTLSAGATMLLTGSTGGFTGSNFPFNFTAISLAPTSTVVYDGNAQTVASHIYGNLTLTCTAGTSFKTMPTAAMIVQGNLVSSIGTGTSVAFSANSNFTVAGNVTIGPSTTFNAGAFIHTIGGNYSSLGVVNASTGKFVFNGTANQTLSTLSAFYRLQINKTTGLVQLNSNITMNDTLVFTRGNIRTGSFKVIINTNGKVGGAGTATGWVFGIMEIVLATGVNITKTFFIGDSLRYAPVTTTFASVTVAGGVNARTTGSDHPQISLSTLNSLRNVNRYWTIANNGITFTSSVLTFNWQAADVDVGAVTTLFKVSRYTGVWDTTAVLNPLPTSIQATGVTFFGDFAVGERCAASVIGNWTGGLSTDWWTPGNWQCGIIPSTTVNALISTGLPRYPVLNSGVGAIRNLTIQPGASVTVTGATLQISGTITNTGTFTVSAGTVELNGTFTQTIPANVFAGNQIANLTTNNAAGVNLSGTLNVTGILKANVGNFNTNGFLTLVSNATQTALIDGAGNGEVLGSVNIQRYLPSGFGYRYISSPVAGATVNQFSDDLNLTATFPTFYRYVENVASTGWEDYIVPANALTTMAGYAGNFGTATAAKTIDMQGVVNNHLKSISLQNNNRPFTLGFNLVGNPFPSPINWDAASGWNRVNIDNAIYYFDAGTVNQYTGTYSSYINGISSNGVATGIIPAMQGFFVHVSNGAFPVNGLLQVDNPARTTHLQPYFHRTATDPSLAMIRLELFFKDGSGLSDAFTVYYDEQASEDFNSENDALKLMNTDSDAPNFYTLSSDRVRLSINSLPGLPGDLPVIPVGLKCERSGEVTLKVVELQNIPDHLNIYFTDSEKRTNYNLRNASDFSFKVEAGNFENQYRILFTEKDLPLVSDIDQFSVYAYHGTIYMYHDVLPGQQATVVITNLQGQIVQQLQVSGNGNVSIPTSLSSGIYIATFRSGNTVYSEKLFINGQ